MSPIALDNVTRISLTAECNYGVGATKPITIHVRRSYNGLDYDTSDSEIFTLNLKSGELARKTFSVKCSGRFIKVLIQNNDRSTTVSDIKVNASVAGWEMKSEIWELKMWRRNNEERGTKILLSQGALSGQTFSSYGLAIWKSSKRTTTSGHFLRFRSSRNDFLIFPSLEK